AGSRQHARVGRRLADSAPGEPAHHRGDGEALEAVDGSRRGDGRPARQHVVGIGAAGARRSGALGSHPTRADGADRGIRRWVYLVVGIAEVLISSGTTPIHTRGEDMAHAHTNLAFVFPGQGSQSIGMLAELSELHPVVRSTFAEASDGASVDLWALSQGGPE